MNDKCFFNEDVGIVSDGYEWFWYNKHISNKSKLTFQPNKYITDYLGNIITHSIEVSTNDYNTMLANLRQIDSIVSANRAELNPVEEEAPASDTAEEAENLDVI